jgi:SAM-dependent methyltransferase
MAERKQPPVSESYLIFDRALLRARRRRAETLGAETFLLERVAEDLADRIAVVNRRFAFAADIGSPGDIIVKALCDRHLVDSVVHMGTDVFFDNFTQVIADEEALPLADGVLDIAVSALSLHHVNDLPGALLQIRRALKPDGLFLAALLGGETLTELRQAFTQAEAEIDGGASPRVAPFADLRDLGALLQRAGFALPVADVDRVVVRYSNAFALMQDLRRMGATNALRERRRKPLRRKTLLRMSEIYGERFADPDGRVRATFDIVWLSGWSPHESQQKPLMPGSAARRLADALKTTEISAREKPGG